MIRERNQAKKARVEHLYAIADGEVIPEAGESEVVFCQQGFMPEQTQVGSLDPETL